MLTWQTSDLWLAAFLIAGNHCNLKNVLDGDGAKKVFVLAPPPSQDVILGFYTGKELVNALKLVESFQRLKAATYSMNCRKRKPIEVEEGGPEYNCNKGHV